jgi:hypothetical protein
MQSPIQTSRIGGHRTAVLTKQRPGTLVNLPLFKALWASKWLCCCSVFLWFLKLVTHSSVCLDLLQRCLHYVDCWLPPVGPAFTTTRATLSSLGWFLVSLLMILPSEQLVPPRWALIFISITVRRRRWITFLCCFKSPHVGRQNEL